MTATNKAVRRVSLASYNFGGGARRLVAQLGHGDVLILREVGRRYRAELPLDWCYRQAVQRRVNAERAERKAARKGGGA